MKQDPWRHPQEGNVRICESEVKNTMETPELREANNEISVQKCQKKWVDPTQREAMWHVTGQVI